MKQKLVLPIIWGALTMYSLGCGGKVVVDSAGAGGAGGTGQGGAGLSSSNSSVSSSSSNSSSGEPSPCDGTTSCEKCVNCTVDIVCSEQWAQCGALQPCMDLVYCLSSCQNEQICIDKCLGAYPEGIDLYTETAQCVICQACAKDCEGLTMNCP